MESNLMCMRFASMLHGAFGVLETGILLACMVKLIQYGAKLGHLSPNIPNTIHSGY